MQLIKKSLPTLHMSWKSKLSLVIATTLIGLILVAGSGLTGLESVSKSFGQQQAVAEYETNSIILAGKLLELKLSSQNLTAENGPSFSQELEDLNNLVVEMKAMAMTLDFKELTIYSDRLERLVNTYVTGSKEILESRTVLGFTPSEGKLKPLYAAKKGLEDISFSMIEEDITLMISGQIAYLISRRLEDKKTLEKGLANLEAIVIDMDWQTIRVGTAVSAYRKAYDEIHILVDKESEINKKLQPVIVELNDIVHQQKTFLHDNVIAQAVEEAKNAQNSASRVMIIAAIIVGIVIFVSLGAIARELNIQLKYMHSFLKQISEGDFSGRLKTNDNEKDEFTQLKVASNLMVQDISEVIAKVVNGND
jgi:hypothetical protein